MTGVELDDFGDLLRYLRRQARLTQRELGMAVGYSEGQISRLEQRRRPPDPVAVAALFVPALRLAKQSTAGRKLVELAQHARRPAPKAADSADIPPPPAHLVARHELLANLAALLAAEGRVVIGGLPGVGKTTLAAAAARERANDRAVCWLTLTAGVTLTVPALVRRVTQILGEPDIPQQHLALDERLRLLASGLAAQPTLLCLDNGHLLAKAPAVLAVVRHILATTNTELLVTSRVDLRLPGAAALRVDGLRPAEGSALVTGLATLPTPLAAELVARTDGNPMLIRLALARLRAGGDPAEFVARLETQPEIAGYLLDTTIGSLSTDARRLVELIAVCGHPVDLFDTRLTELSHRVVGRYDVLAGMAELQDRHLLTDPTAAVLHPLVADRVRAELATDPTGQRLWHRMIALWAALKPGIVRTGTRNGISQNVLPIPRTQIPD
ncbi:MAG TPA: helix-turn-helix domain-containing protein [Pseudonocardiaceae bacterium]|jgi:ATP/maltotriose-dependent transcriptional regulator MalT|nr:helix-turn-helix domain-containing protein [Pseudonocardiaceae bacterium]